MVSQWKEKRRVTPHQGCQMVFFKPKIQIWVLQLGNWKCRYILRTFGPFYNLLVYFMDIWYTYIVEIRYIFPLLIFCINTNLATLLIPTLQFSSEYSSLSIMRQGRVKRKTESSLFNADGAMFFRRSLYYRPLKYQNSNCT
jgi:hypothetical protein